MSPLDPSIIYSGGIASAVSLASTSWLACRGFPTLQAAHSYRALFAANAATTAIFSDILWAALPETRPEESGRGEDPRGAVRAILRDRAFLAVCLLSLAFCIVFF